MSTRKRSKEGTNIFAVPLKDGKKKEKTVFGRRKEATRESKGSATENCSAKFGHFS